MSQLRRRFYPKITAPDSFKAFGDALKRLHERLDHQDNVLDSIAEQSNSIREQTMRTNGRVTKLETQRDTLHSILLKAGAAVAFAVTSGLALYAAIK